MSEQRVARSKEKTLLESCLPLHSVVITQFTIWVIDELEFDVKGREAEKKISFFSNTNLFVVDFKERGFDNVGAIRLSLLFQPIEKVNERPVNESMFFRERIRLVVKLFFKQNIILNFSLI